MMNRVTRKWLWAAVGLSLTLGLLWEFFPLKDASDRLKLLPESALGFIGEDLPLTAAERRIFKEARVVKRVYQRGAVCFLLMVIDGTHNRHSVHDPMYCFRGAGWQVAGRTEVPMEGGKASWMRVRRGEEVRHVVYWFSDGRSRYISPLRYWAQTTLRRLTFGALGPEPVLVEIQPCGGQAVEWGRMLNVFVPLQEI